MYKRVCLLLFAAILAGSVVHSDSSGNGAIVGTVRENTASGTPIEDAYVRAISGPSGFYSDYTNAEGQYSMPKVAPDWYLVIASKEGYADGYAVVHVNPDEIVVQHFALTPLE